jgi:predicted glutamine amidotransferase
MCRFFGFLGSAPAKTDWYLTRAENSLLAQSRHDLSGDSHGDGWGIGHYVNGLPVVAWSAAPASKDGQIEIISRAISSHAVIAHVRDASVGVSALANTHPFPYGPWLFAHNGTVRPFERVAPTLMEEIPAALLSWRRGNTDSELAFYWLLARMSRAGIDPMLPGSAPSVLSQVLAASVTELASRCARAGNGEPAKFNFLLCDGTNLLATRWGHSLYWSRRSNGVAIASEPVDPVSWQEVPERSLLCVDSALQVVSESL